MNSRPALKMRVELYGLEKIPETQRQTKWYEYAIIQGSFMVNTGNFLIPAFAVLHGGMSIFLAVISTLMGAILANLCVSALSIPGSKYGLPAQYAIRYILGVRGTKWVSSPVRLIISLYWFSVQTIGGAIVLKQVLLTYFNIELPSLVLAVLLGIIIVFLAFVGFEAIKSALKKFLPVVLLGQAVILFLLIKGIVESGDITAPLFSNQEVSLKTFLFYGSLTFVQYISTVNSSSDLTRYSRSTKDGFFGLFIGSTVGFSIATVMGALSAGIYQNTNPFISTIESTDSKITILLILLTAILSMVSVNLNNVYAGSFCLLNIFPEVQRTTSTLILGIAAIALCLFPDFVNKAEAYISLLGLISIPLSSVIFTDFILVKKSELPETRQFDDNKKGLLLIILGTVFYSAIPDEYSPAFLTFVLVGVLYGLLKKVEWMKFSP